MTYKLRPHNPDWEYVVFFSMERRTIFIVLIPSTTLLPGNMFYQKVLFKSNWIWCRKKINTAYVRLIAEYTFRNQNKVKPYKLQSKIIFKLEVMSLVAQCFDKCKNLTSGHFKDRFCKTLYIWMSCIWRD